MTLKIQYCSDLHMEFLSMDKIPKLLKNVGADVLILSGDISVMGTTEDYAKFIKFLEYYGPKYKFIIAVSGNHEYYSHATPKTIKKENTMPYINKRLKDLRKTFKNYYYLDCNTVQLNINGKDYNFIGASMWTKVEHKDWPKIQQVMNDYSSIWTLDNKDHPTRFTVEEMQKLHKKHITFIKRAVLTAKEKKMTSILLTHHQPIATTAANEQTVYTQAYETDITKIVNKPIVLAFFGHSHISFNKVINGVRYVSNPKGYPNERTGFKNNLLITI